MPGYEEFLEAIGNPDHEEFDDYVAWAGGYFDPAVFDLAAANARLQKIASPTCTSENTVRLIHVGGDE